MQTFTVFSKNISERLDPFYYQESYIKSEAKITNFRFASIKELCFELKNGSTPPGGKFEEEGVPYFRSQDFDLYEISVNQFISEEFHNSLERSKVIPQDVLIAVVGATLGQVGYIPDSIKDGNINQNICRLRVKDKDQLIPKYLAIFLSTSVGQNLIFRNATITTQAYINNGQLGQILIPIPSFDVQQDIVDIMDSAYSLKKEKEHQADSLLNKIDNYIMNQLGFKLPVEKKQKIYLINSDEIKSNRIDPYFFKPVFFNFEKQLHESKYEIVCFSDLINNLINGFDYRSFEDEGTLYLKVANIKPYRVDFKKPFYIDLENNPISKDIYLKKGDLLLTRKGTYGVAVSIKEDCDFIICSEIFKITVRENVSADYLEIILNSSIGQIQFDRNKIGAIMGSLAQEAVKAIFIPVPPVDIQNKIISEVQNNLLQSNSLRKSAFDEIEKAKKEVEKILFKD